MAHRREPPPDLFATPAAESTIEAPLAERLRPQAFEDFIGQESIVGKERPLRKAIETDRLTSVILWGPPGCGKTTLAHLISRYTKGHFVSFSAVTSGIPELREILKGAQHRLVATGQKT
ncbi:AAA family ATPase, partial [Petrachloros mirabilis]